MKKSTRSLLLLVLACFIVSCAKTNLQRLVLKYQVMELNNSCPYTSGSVTYNSYTLEDSTLIINTSVDDAFLDAPGCSEESAINFRNMTNEFAKLYIVGIRQYNVDLLQLLVDSDIDVKAICSGFSNREYVSECTAAEIKAIYSDPRQNPEELLVTFIKSANVMFPMDMGVGIIGDSLIMEDDAVMMNCTIIDSLVANELRKVDQDSLLEICIKSFRNGGKNITYEMAVDARRGFGMRYRNIFNDSIIEMKKDYEALKEYIKTH